MSKYVKPSHPAFVPYILYIHLQSVHIVRTTEFYVMKIIAIEIRTTGIIKSSTWITNTVHSYVL